LGGLAAAMLVVGVALSVTACGGDASDCCAPSTHGLTLFRGRVWGGNLAVADGVVYFTTYTGDPIEHAVLSVPVSGGEPTTVTVSGRGTFGNGMAVRNGRVYWLQNADVYAGQGAIYGATLPQGELMTVSSFSTPAVPRCGVAADDAWIYAATTDEIVRVPLDGGDAATLYSGAIVWGTVLRERNLYFIGDGALGRVNLDSGLAELLAPIDGLGAFGPFDVDADAAYVPAENGILRVPLDGSAAVALTRDVGTAVAVVASTDDVFAIAGIGTDKGSYIVRVPKSGGAAVPVHEGSTGIGSLALHDTTLYAAYCCGDAGGEVVRFDL
jgi:hypothetical protein